MNNIPAERHLAAFGRRVPMANFRNKKFKVKAIRKYMTLYQSTTFSNSTKNKNFQVVMKLLNDMEMVWADEQKELKKAKILEKLEKAKNVAKYTQKLLQICKSWRGPVTSVEELHQILKGNANQQEKIVQTELSFFRDTHTLIS